MRLMLLVFALLIPVAVYSQTCVKYDSNGQKHYYKCPENERSLKIQYDITTTRKNGKITKKEIVTDSVCKNYENGSIKRRNCLSQAKDKFEDQCYTWTQKYKNTYGNTDAIAIERDMYCDAEYNVKFMR